MSQDLPVHATAKTAQNPSQNPSGSAPKPPRQILEGVFAFPPNRDTLGGTAYLLTEANGSILVDCPAWNEINQSFLKAHSPVRWLFLTHRTAIGPVGQIQRTLDCDVLLQEQEAYLLPGVPVKTFQQTFGLSSSTRAIWTSGHSPGSSCLYTKTHGGILFTGRHLLPNRAGYPAPLHNSKTFHWPRQIRSVQRLLQEFSPGTLQFICPGANTGFLRGRGVIDHAYQRLAQLDLVACLQEKPLL